MTERFDELEQKVDRMIRLIGELRQENARMKDENHSLRNELDGARQQLDQLRLLQNDQSEAVKAKLASILQRIEELEHLGA